MARGGPFAAPAELAMCLCWGLARILRVSGGNAVQGLLSRDAYVEWSEAELGKQNFLPHLCYADSLSQYKTIPRPTSKHSSYHYSNLSLQSSSVFSLLARLTAHSSWSGHTLLQRSLPFLVPFFLASGLPRYLSISPISNTFVPPMQWSTSYSHLFTGKTHQVTSRPVPSADLAALRLYAYPRASKTGFGATRPCSQDRPLDRGNTRGFNPVAEPAPYASSA